MAPDLEPSPAPELVSEKDLSEQLGVPIKKIRDARPPTAVRHDGEGGYCWPLDLARAFASHHGIPFEGPEKKTAPAEAETLTVVSLARTPTGHHFANKNLIQAKRANGDLVFVRVVSSAKYRPMLHDGSGPMTLQARRSEAGNWWILVGREPRWPARW